MFLSIRNLIAYLFVALLPWQTAWIVREVFVGGEKAHYSSMILPVALVVLSILVMMSGQVLIAWWRHFFYKKVAVAIFLVLFLSVLAAYDPVGAAYHASILVISFLGTVVMVRLNLSWQKMVGIFVLSMSGHAFLAHYQFIMQSSFASTWLGMSLYDAAVGGVSVIEAPSGRWLRAYGGFSHPNILGGMMAATSILCISMYLFRASRRAENIFYLVCIVLCAAALALSFSRSGVIGLVVGLIILGIATLTTNSLSRRRLFFGGSVCVLAVSMLFYLYSDLFQTRIDPTQRLEARSISERTQYVSESLRLFSEKPFFGVGIKSYIEAARRADADTRPIWKYQPVHNTPLLVAVETGFLGFVAFCVALAIFVHTFRSSLWSQKELIMLAPLGVIVTQSFFDHWQWSSVFGVMVFFFFCGLAYAAAQKAYDARV